ncbi:MAG TPA: MmgE/PrpD family protein, partial [Burkholderiaceae bacterium]|nr:MmgE/PrpD family protein [Burkholderiaceae bacterium]
MNKPEDVNTMRSADQQLQPVTLEYARFTEQLTFAHLPDDVALTCQEQAVATIGSCLAGTLMPGARSIERALGIFGDGQAATLFGRKEKMPAPGAALFNAATGQIIEWDDWVLISHVGACVIPVAFAVGELAKSSGKDVLTAIAIGNEIAGRTSRAIQRGGYLGNGMPNHQVEAPLVA